MKGVNSLTYMLMQSIYKYLKITAVSLLSILLLINGGCGRNSSSEGQQQSTDSTMQTDRVPDDLKSIEESIEEIIMLLEGPSVKENEGSGKNISIKENEGEKNPAQKESPNNNGSQSNEGSSENSGSQSKENQSNSATKPQDSDSMEDTPIKNDAAIDSSEEKWSKISSIINTMHYKWNSFMPASAKKGAARELMDNFSIALNSLTDTIVIRNSTNTLLAASYLYAYVCDFYSLYIASVPPEIKKLLHYTRNASLNAYTANWEQSDSDMANLEALWKLMRNTLLMKNPEMVQKIDYSIYEMERVILEHNQPLSDIKGRITLYNISELEKSLEDSQQHKHW